MTLQSKLKGYTDIRFSILCQYAFSCRLYNRAAELGQLELLHLAAITETTGTAGDWMIETAVGAITSYD